MHGGHGLILLPRWRGKKFQGRNCFVKLAIILSKKTFVNLSGSSEAIFPLFQAIFDKGLNISIFYNASVYLNLVNP